jgi:HlyD family secretion protein
MSAKVAFLSQALSDDKRHPLAVVQGDAITQRNGKSVVFVIRDGIAHAVPVTPGQKINDDVELSGVSASKIEAKMAIPSTSGLKVGERVVIKPSVQIEDGKHVSVAQK